MYLKVSCLFKEKYKKEGIIYLHNVTILEHPRTLVCFENRIPYGEIVLGIKSGLEFCLKL